MTDNKAAIVLFAALAVFGTLHGVQAMSEEIITMQGHHWIMLIVVLAAGYVAGRLFAQPARMLGLP